MEKCPYCGSLVSQAAAFCGECGRPIPATHPCYKCGFAGNPPEAGYCVRCGAPLGKRSFPLIWIAALAVLVLLAGAVIVLWQGEFLKDLLHSRSTSQVGPGSLSTTMPAQETATPALALIPSLSPTPQPMPIVSTPTITQPPTATARPATPSPAPTRTPPAACPGAPPQRVRIGEAARVCTAYDQLKVRARPGLGNREVTRLRTGTYLSIVDGPVCANNWSWWQVRTDSGLIGWVAEGGDHIDPYFICPVR